MTTTEAGKVTSRAAQPGAAEGRGEPGRVDQDERQALPQNGPVPPPVAPQAAQAVAQPAPPDPPEPPAAAGIPAARPPLRRNALPVVAGIVALGLLLGLVVGTTLALLRPATVTASALVQVSPSPSASILRNTGQPGPSAEEISAFVSAELAWLSDEQYAEAVRQKLGVATAPVITASRVDTSQLIKITGSGTSPEQAAQVTQTAVDVYAERSAAETRRKLDDAIRGVDATIAQLSRGPDAATQGNRIGQLLDVRVDLQLRSAQADGMVQMVSPPSVAAGGATPPGVLGGLLGAVVGGLIAVSGLLVWRARTPVLLTPEAVEDAVGDVLTPVVELSAQWADHNTRPGTPERATGRLLLARVGRDRPLEGRVIAVVGASEGSESDAVASMLAVAAAEQLPTIMLQTSSVAVDGLQRVRSPADPTGRGRTLIEGLAVHDVPRPAESAEARSQLVEEIKTLRSHDRLLVVHVGDAGGTSGLGRLLRSTTDVVLAVGLGVDKAVDAAAVGGAARAGAHAFATVVTKPSWRMVLARRKATRDLG